jgi:hypothetical protein
MISKKWNENNFTITLYLGLQQYFSHPRWHVNLKKVQLIDKHFKFLKSLLVMVTFGLFVFAPMKDVDDDSPISCEARSLVMMLVSRRS